MGITAVSAHRSQSPRLPEDRTDAPACTAYEPQPVSGYKSSGAVFKYVGCVACKVYSTRPGDFWGAHY